MARPDLSQEDLAQSPLAKGRVTPEGTLERQLAH